MLLCTRSVGLSRFRNLGSFGMEYPLKPRWHKANSLGYCSHHLGCHCRWDNTLHMEPAYSAQFRGLESAIKVSSNTTFFYPIKLENYTGRIKSGFSEVLRTSPYPSHKIQLILTILTVVSLFPYLFWGTRNGSCRFLFTCFFSESPGRIRSFYISLERYF